MGQRPTTPVDNEWETVSGGDEWETVPSKPKTPAKPFPLQMEMPSAASRFGGSLAETLQSGAKSLLHPIDTAKSMFYGGPEQSWEKAFNAPSLSEKIGHGLAAISGPIGGIAEGIGEQAGRGDIAGAAGTATAAFGLPELMKGAPRAGRLVNDMARGTAERLYESALKPGPRSNPLDKVRRMVGTGLDEGIRVSEGGVKKLHSLQDEINAKVGSTITNNAAPINKFAVTRRLNEPARQFSQQVNPEADLAALSDTGNEFLRNQPTDISPVDAQALKQGTYKQLKNRSYGELKNASVEGQKALARGLKEEIEARFPNVKGLNARNSNLFNLQKELETAVNRSANHNIMGLTGPIVGAGVEAATGSLPAAIAAGVLKQTLGRPVVKSGLAIALARMARR